MQPKNQANKLVTASDVARAAGVSQSTVSRAFAANATSTPKNKAHILEVARQLNYHPNAFARALASKHSGIIALLASGLDDSFFSVILHGLSAALQKKGLQLLVFGVESRADLASIYDKLEQYRVDGMIFTAPFFNKQDMAELGKLQKPMLMINHYHKTDFGHAVCCDAQLGAKQIVAHLADLQLKNIGCLAGPQHFYTSSSRYKAFKQALADQQLALTAHATTCALQHQEGLVAAKNLVQEKPCLEAMFCTNDILALGAIDAMRELSLDHKIAIVGFDGHHLAAWPSYQLTTVEQPVEQLVEACVDTLCQGIEAAKVGTSCRLLSGQLICRASSLQGI